jgi:1,4-dihydroxy-2-naphthoyl-CoA hydrolase
VNLADPPCGYPAAANLRDGATGFTVTELKSNFFAAALEVRAHARTAPVHLGSTPQAWDCWLTRDKGRRMALFRRSQRVLRPKG